LNFNLRSRVLDEAGRNRLGRDETGKSLSEKDWEFAEEDEEEEFAEEDEEEEFAV
jgi:hypothetical protein